MSSLRRFVISLAAALSLAASAFAFVHPGGLHTQADLDRMKTQVAAGAHPWIDGWNLLIQDPLAQSTYVAKPQANMGSSRQAADLDAHAAYLNAIRWYVSGDTRYADCAVSILNGWTQKVNQVPTGTDTPGLIAIPIQNFALAAEVLRVYPGWSQTDMDAFKTMCATYLYPVVNDFLTNHNGQGATHYWANWDACNIGALLAMGVFCDNQSWFDQGVTYFKSGIGAGAINNAVVALYPGNLYNETIGQWQESGRDQSHAQLGLGLIGYVCQTAWNQGVDLFGYASNRFLSGAEYVAQYNLWHDVPYTAYTNTDPVTCPYPARNFRGQYGDRPVYELLFNHYTVRAGLYAPNVKAFAELQRPEAGSNDHFGYGTLTFTLAAANSPYPVLAAPPAPTGLTATPTVGAVWLSWTAPVGDVAAGYNVLRATKSGGPYTTIYSSLSGTKNDAAQYTDSGVTNGTTYYYVVQAVNQSGTSSNSAEVSALPVSAMSLAGGWAEQDIGTVTTPGSATCSAINGNTFIVSGSGSDISGTADSFHYVYQSVSGDFTFIGRLGRETLSDSDADKIGLMMRESLSAGSRNVALILYSSAGGKQQVQSRANTGGSTSSIIAQNYVYAPQWFKLERSGNTFTGSISLDGTSWLTTGSVTVSMSSTYYAGIAVCSRSSTGALTSGLMDNVTSVAPLPNPPVITSSGSASGTVGTPFSYQITATADPTSYNAAGLPAGLSIDTATGLISGTPTVSGTFNATMTATNASGSTNAIITVTINPATATNGTWNTSVGPLTLNLTFTASSSSVAYTVTSTSPAPASTTPVVGDALRLNTTVGNFSNSNAYFVVAVNTGNGTLQLGTARGGAAQTASAAGTSAAPIYMRWSDAVDWVNGSIANGYGAVATIPALPSNVRIALGGNWTVGTINFAGGGGSDLDISGYDYATAAGGSITFATGTSATPLFSVGRNTTFPVNMPSTSGSGARIMRVFGNQGLEIMSSSDSTVSGSASFRPNVGLDWSGFSGDLQVRQGRIDVIGANVLPNASNLVLGNGNTAANRFAVLSMFIGRSQTIGALSGTAIGRVSAGTSSSSSAGTAVTLTIGANNGSGTFAGIIGADAAGSSANTTTVSIVKTGSGTEVFSGANIYTGATTVNQGVFLLNGSLVSPVTVNAGVFGGAGSTSNSVVIGTGVGAGANFAPGNNGIGTFTTTGSLTLRSDATLLCEFSPSTVTADQIAANGVTLNNAIFSPQIVGSSTAISGGTVFKLINNTSATAVTGTFNGLPEGSTVTVGVNSCRLSYVGGDGNDVTLTVLGGAQPPVITSTSASGAFGANFSFAVVASNTPTGFSASGLPPGLTINPTTGVISGTPLAAGTFTATITATNGAGSSSAPLTLTISTIVGVNLRAYNTYGMTSTDVAGVVRSMYWNNLVGPATTGEIVSTNALIDNLGLPVSGMSVSFTAGTTGGSYSNSGTLKFGSDAVTVGPASNDANLYSSAFDQYDSSPSVLSVTGIPYASYDVIFYIYDGGATQGGVITANGQRLAVRGGVGNPDTNGAGYIASTDAVNTSGSAVQQGNYVRFTGLSGNLNATLLATNVGSATMRLKLAGFQIVSRDSVPAPIATPAAPSQVTASGGNTQVTLNWSYVPTATSYNIYRGGALLATVASPLASYADTTVANGASYSYTVSAVNGVGEGPQSTSASATPAAPSFTLPPRTVYQYSLPMAPIFGSWSYDSQRRAYLWIPPGCVKIQGVVFGLHNMLEKPLFDDPAIRQACAEANLAIVFVSPGDSKTWTPNGVGNYTAGKPTTAIDLDPNNYVSADINPNTSTNYATDINPVTGTRFANQAEQAGAEVAALLKKFADESGYSELEYAPIMFAGHSAASPFVWTRSVYSTSSMSGRVFAILPYKGTFPGSIPDGMPVFHTASEWQEISNWGNTWELGDAPQLRALRAGGTNRLLSSLIQPGTGHYDYDETQSGPIALFIKKAAQYRIPANWPATGYPTLNTISAASGYLVDVTKVGTGAAQPVAYADWVGAGKDPLRAYWYFDAETAQAVCAVENAGFAKRPQMINAYQNATTLAPLATQNNGVGYVSLSASLQADGTTFKVQGASMSQSPVSRLFNGAPLGMPTGPITFKANGSGALKQVGPDTFRVWLDRGTVIKEGQPWEPFIIAYHPGDGAYRSADRPIWLMSSTPVNNITGSTQTITFPAVPDQLSINLKTIKLNATSSSGLPVQYWVVSGPYRNDENDSSVLIPDQMPARPTYPMHVVVGAWQWGKPGVTAAATAVYQTFDIVAPPPIPGAPTALNATATGPEFLLTWSPGANASTYTVKRGVTSGGPYVTLATGLTSASYLDVGTVFGTAYYYVVSSSNVTGDSGNSTEISATATVSSANGAWIQAGSTTNYNDVGNWTNGVAASGVGAIATLSKAGPTVVVNTNVTIGGITGSWTSGASLRLSGLGNTLTWATASSTPPTLSLYNWFSRYDYISDLNFAGTQGLTFIGKSNVLVLQSGVTWNGFSGPFTLAPNTDGSMVYAQAANVLPAVDLTLTPGTGTNGYRHSKLVLNGDANQTIGALNSTTAGNATTYISSYSAPTLLTGAAPGGVNTVGFATLTIGVTNNDGEFRGKIGTGYNNAADTEDPSANLLNLVKGGSGVQILSGANNYVGSTTVAQGGLYVNGSHVASGAGVLGSYDVLGTLGGSGTIKPSSDSAGTQMIFVESGGTLEPGSLTVDADHDNVVDAASATLTLDQSASTRGVLALAAGSHLRFRLGAGGSATRLAVVGLTASGPSAVTFNGATVDLVDLANGALAPGLYTLVHSDGAGAYAGLSVNADNVIVGGLTLGSSFDAYAGSTLRLVGNDIVLALAPPSIVGASNATGVYGQPFSYTIMATHAPTQFAASGLPSGLTLDSATGAISGSPTAVGTFTVTLGAANAAGVGSANLVVTISPAPATVAFDNLVRVYTGSPQPVTVTTSPANLAVTITYSGGSSAPTMAGSYAIVATVTNANYVGSASDTLVIGKAAPMVAVTPYSVTYDGVSHRAVGAVRGVLGEPLSGLSLDATAHTNAGAYSDGWTFIDVTGNYLNASGVVNNIIAKATPIATVTGYSIAYDAQPHTATGSVVGVRGEALSGLSLAATTHTTVGVYNDHWTFSDGNGNYTDLAGDVSDTISKGVATITLAPLTQTYDGSAKPVIATTAPAGLTVDIAYDGVAAAPVYPGAHTVVCTITDPNYSGSKSDTLTISTTALVRHAPTINGILDGSAQMLNTESLTLNSSASISGDLLVVGSPAVTANGGAIYAGTIDGPGSATPTNYSIALNAGAVLRHAVRRIDPITMPVVAVPSSPTGTRDVTLNSPGGSIGDATTLRNLTLNSNAGNVAVPSGNYGAFTINSGSTLVLGVAGATEPVVYNFRSLTVNSGGSVQVVGPVAITVASGLTLNGPIGKSDHPEWLILRIPSSTGSASSVTLNGSAVLYGTIINPTGSVTVNGGSTIHGQVVADRLTINGNGLISQP